MKAVQIRIDDILGETEDWYLQRTTREQLVERLVSEGYPRQESLQAVLHYDR